MQAERAGRIADARMAGCQIADSGSQDIWWQNPIPDQMSMSEFRIGRRQIEFKHSKTSSGFGPFPFPPNSTLYALCRQKLAKAICKT